MYFTNDPVHTLENLVSKYKSKSISIYLLVVISVLSGIFSLPYIEVDISSQSRGIIKSIYENTPVSSIVGGLVIQNNLRSNASVNKGDTLVAISVENIDTDIGLYRRMIDVLQQKYHDLETVLSGVSKMPSTAVERDEYFKYQAQKSELESRLNLAELKFDRNDKMFRERLIAKVEHENSYYDLEYAKLALETLIKNQYAQWQSQKDELFIQIKNIQGTIQRTEIQKVNYVITAASSGSIENFIGIQVGSYVNAGQVLAEISSDDDLVVETIVSPKDIGLIKVGQQVKFQMDAFNYNQWGLLTGKVLEINKNISIINNNPFFKVRCSLDSMAMHLKTGYTTNVSKGMTLTSRFTITRRSLYQLLFDKMDDWLNPKLLEN